MNTRQTLLISSKLCSRFTFHVSLLLTLVLDAPAQTPPALAALTTCISLSWDASPDPNVIGYNLYYGTNSGTYIEKVNVGNVTTYEVITTLPLPLYFAVTGYDSSEVESPFSNQAYWDGLMETDVTNLVTVAFTKCYTNPTGNKFFRLQTSTDLQHWSADPDCRLTISNQVTYILTNAP